MLPEWLLSRKVISTKKENLSVKICRRHRSSPWHLLCTSARFRCSHRSSSKRCFRVSAVLCSRKDVRKMKPVSLGFYLSFAIGTALSTRNSGTGHAGFLSFYLSFALRAALSTQNSGTGKIDKIRKERNRHELKNWKEFGETYHNIVGGIMPRIAQLLHGAP